MCYACCTSLPNLRNAQQELAQAALGRGPGSLRLMSANAPVPTPVRPKWLPAVVVAGVLGGVPEEP